MGHGIEGVLSPALHCLQRLSGCVLLPSTIWIVSFFCIYVAAILLLVGYHRKTRKRIKTYLCHYWLAMAARLVLSLCPLPLPGTSAIVQSAHQTEDTDHSFLQELSQ